MAMAGCDAELDAISSNTCGGGAFAFGRFWSLAKSSGLDCSAAAISASLQEFRMSAAASGE